MNTFILYSHGIVAIILFKIHLERSTTFCDVFLRDFCGAELAGPGQTALPRPSYVRGFSRKK